MSVTIHEVLGALRASALDERDKGDKFERLVSSLLRTDPEWTAKFSQVWAWSEWPERGNAGDTGIDLVAQLRDRDSYAAIQCKFYNADKTVPRVTSTLSYLPPRKVRPVEWWGFEVRRGGVT